VGPTETDIPRRKFIATATIAIGGVIGLALTIPIAGSLVPEVGAGGTNWTPLDAAGWKELQIATDKPVNINISLNVKDAYLPRQTAAQSVWGIKVKDLSRFKSARPDLFSSAGRDTLPYSLVTMGFAIFSPVCPHLGCSYVWDDNANRFICHCHGSQYTYEGEHVAGPAARGLDPLPLREHSGNAQIEWIRYAPTIPSRLVVSYVD
jgi:menaquinol-cytochrome c reductase iron-sulfur subunit